jgi:predicted permease
MALKLLIMPILTVGISKAFNLDDEPGRATVLIACLSISMASFTLGSRYEICEAILSENVILGTILFLPTVRM